MLFNKKNILLQKKKLLQKKINNLLLQKKINNFINKKLIQKNNNNYNPNLNNIKYLLIMACHCETNVKFNTILNNMTFLDYSCIDKILINSTNTNYATQFLEICNNYKNTKYYEIENTTYLDFGKWLYVLETLININDYDYIILKNDSFIIHDNINHFFNLIYKNNTELYGYNDSTQDNYHYQSYLFSIKKKSVNKFIEKIKNPNVNIKTQRDVIENFELSMTKWFNTCNVFLKIGNINIHKTLNIFFNNDKLYIPLKKSGILPFTKLKRIM